MFNEASYENAVISLLEGLGYEHKYGPDIERDYHNPLYMDVLPKQLAVINPRAKSTVIEEAVNKITNIENGSYYRKIKPLQIGSKTALRFCIRKKAKLKQK
jgi:type I restriction enzyme R subunit